MGDFFLQLFNLSVNASYLVFAVLLARLLLKKAPKWVNCILWGIVGLRLVFPFEIESVLSLIPSPEFVPDSMVYTNGAANVTGGEALSYIGNNPVDYSLGIDGGRLVFNEITAPDADVISPLLIATNVLAIVWVVGVAVMLICSFISFLKVKKSVREAMHVQENIYLCDNISTPFILGIVKPKIYLPSSLYKEDVLYVIDHEKAHIKRLDHLWKPLGYLLLTVYWFNPVMWLAYIFLCKDIELACDEKVIRELDKDSKKGYSNALINCSSQRRLISACPLAFGETGVKNRIKSVLSYKKPAFWVVFVSLVVCVIITIGFMTVPSENKKPQTDTVQDDTVQEYVYYGSREIVKPTLVLKSDGTFVFNYSSYSSYIAVGKYTQEENILTLVTDDGQNTYTFDVTEDGFSFDAFNSSDIPYYKVSRDSDETYCPVPDNAVFIDKQIVGTNSYFDATVLEVGEGNVLVEPMKGEPLSNSTSMLWVSTKVGSTVSVPYLREGDEIRIVYDGMIQETFPGQINGTIAIYMLESVVSNELSYSLGGDGIKYIEYMSRETTDELAGETSEYSQKITEAEKIQHFVELFNEILATSSIDELDTPEYPDEALPDIAFINVHYADGSVAKIVLPGYERVRLGVNERRLISSYERELLVESLVDSKQKKIEAIVSGTLGRVELTDEEFLNKAYTLTCDVSYLELTRLFGEAPYTESWDGIETYYYFNDEYVLFIEEGIQVSLRKISDPDYRHTIA